MNPRNTLFALSLGLVLSGCAQYASVSERRPQFHPLRSMASSLMSVEQRIRTALRKERGEPLAALGEYLAAAQTAARELERNPADTVARDDYNFAVARAIGTIKRAKLEPWEHPLRVPAPDGDFVLAFKPDPRPQWNPALYTFVPADQFDVKGHYVTDHTRKEGLGAPLVAIGREMNKNAKENFSLQRIFYGVTAVIRFEGRRAVVALEDPLSTERIRFGGRSFPLAADFTVPLAVMLASANPVMNEVPRMIRPDKFAETARITRLQPYDPNKAVVLVVHGLMDSPATWTPMINRLRADPDIRENFQFWFFSYPSGYPYPHAAAILRRELDRAEEIFPINKPMVVIGHSMGGCIGRLLVTDSGDQLWTAMFQKPPAETDLPEKDRRIIEEALIFQRRQEIGRVIFISAPLRGTEFALNALSRFGSMLIQTPSNLRQTVRSALQALDSQSSQPRNTNAIETLAPAHRFVQAINRIPINSSIPLHVISGDQGKGGNKDRSKPEMSDGIVPYWSSHIEGAVSELVVPSAHSAHQHPEAIDEVRRILLKI